MTNTERFSRIGVRMKIPRRRFLKKLAASGGLIPAGIAAFNRPQCFAIPGQVASIPGAQSGKTVRIDRAALGARHNPILRELDPLSPLSLGNGEFAFTADITGLQTFPESHNTAMPLCTMSQWGWHTSPLPPGLDPRDFRLAIRNPWPVGRLFDQFGRAKRSIQLAARKSASSSPGTDRPESDGRRRGDAAAGRHLPSNRSWIYGRES